MTLMDSDVCIDLLREHPPALEWFAGLNDIPAIPGFCALELVMGAERARELKVVQKFLARFGIVWPGEEDLQRGLMEFAPLHLTHGLGGLDVLIAATAVGKGATFFTFNARHFRAVSGLVIEQPYAR